MATDWLLRRERALHPAGIKRWRSDWARLNDWRINNDLFDYYVEYAEEAVPWVISQGRSVGIEPIEFLTDSSIRYDDGSVVAVCDATPSLESGPHDCSRPKGSRRRCHVLLRNPLRAARPGRGRHHHRRHRQAKRRHLCEAHRHKGRGAGRRRLHEQRVYGGSEHARCVHVPPLPGQPHR